MLKLSLTAAVATLSLASGAEARVTDADRAFLTQDIQGGRYELALAQLGAAKATKPAIRQFSQMVVRDHTQANATLTRLAQSEGVNTPGGLTTADTGRLAKLRAMNGAAFDKAYVDEQNRINTEDEKDADKEQATTRDPAIKAYLSRFAAMDARHKRGAELLRKS